VDQQRELMRYMSGLNDWLARDVQDRQAELRGVTARVDQLREDLGRLGVGAGPGWCQYLKFDTIWALIPDLSQVYLCLNLRLSLRRVIRLHL
jgi:hypothetical protein